MLTRNLMHMERMLKGVCALRSHSNERKGAAGTGPP
jgi:hypothetical protein